MNPLKMEFTSPRDGLRDYYMFHDAGPDSLCLVFLHGHGSHGDQLFTRPDIASNIPLIERFRMSVIAPNLRDNAWMSSAAADDLRYILEKHKRENRFSRYIFLSGSMGGTGALIFAVRYPELVDALGIMGGATDIARYRDFCREGKLPVHRDILNAIETHYAPEDFERNNVCAQAGKLTMPLCFYHGEQDETMPVSEMTSLRNLMKDCPNAQFRILPGGNHDSPLPFFGEILEKITGLRDFKSVCDREHATAAPQTTMAGSIYRYNLFMYYQGEYFATCVPGTPECLNRARSLEYALNKIPLSFPDDQEFFGGAELFMRVDLPDGITEADYNSKMEACGKHGVRYFGVGWDHAAPDFRTLMKSGIGGFIERAEEASGKSGSPVSQAMALSLRAMSNFFLRAADFCGERREAADRLRRMATEAPADFSDALQLMWLVFVVLAMEGRYHNALARMDQYLLEFHKAEDTTLEINRICHIFCKVEGFHQIINICIGGVKPDGSDASNDLSYMILTCVGMINSSSTNLSARVHDGSPDRYLLACIHLISTGIGFPAIMNDHVYIPSLMHAGIPLEAARDYALFGCVEGAIPGRQPAWSDSRFNLPKVFTDVITRLEEFDTYEELWNAFSEGVFAGMRLHLEKYDQPLKAVPPEFFPDPMLSALTRDCIARGLDINDGGAEFPRIHGVGMMGLATIADSMAAVKKLVYEEKRISRTELLKALKEDFANDEILRQTLIHCAPKYGNDDDYVDSIAMDVVKLCCESALPLRTCNGGYMLSCMASNVSSIFAGEEVPATPDGRHAWKPLSDAASPDGGLDRHGPTAFMNSIVRPEYSAQNCTVVNMRFLPEMFTDEGGELRMLALLRKFIEGRGHEIQFNVTNNAMLEDAMAHPEKYGDLMVRVSGFSAFFTKLVPQIQRDIIRRNAHGR